MPYFVFHFLLAITLMPYLVFFFILVSVKKLEVVVFTFWKNCFPDILCKYCNCLHRQFCSIYAHGAVCVACFLKSDDIGNISVRRGWTYIPFISQNQVRVNLHLIKCIAGYWNGKGISGIKIFSYKFVGCRTLVYNLITCNGVWRVYSLHIEGISAGWCIGRFNLYLWIKRGTSHSTGRNRNAGWIQCCDFNNVSSSCF